MKLSSKAQILIAVPLCFEIAFVSALIHTQNQLNKSFEQQASLNETLKAVSSIIKAMPQALFESGLYQFSHSERFSIGYQRSVAEIKAGIAEIKALEAGDKSPLLSELDEATNRALDKMETTHISFKSENQYMIMANLLLYKRFVDRVIEAADRLSEEKRIKIESQKAYEERLKSTMAVISSIGVTVSVLLSLALAVSFQKVLSNKIAVLSNNGTRLATGQPLLPALAGDDELSKLDSNFHEMANALAYLRSKELAVVDNAVEIICSLDSTAKFIQVNKAIFEILQFAPEELIGKSITTLSPMSQVDLKNAFNRSYGSTQSHVIEIPCFNKNLQVKDLQWSITWSEEEQTFFCIAHDVTERNRVDQLKRDMIAMVSHDLRSPLTSLQAYFEFLGSGRYGQLTAEGDQKVFQAEGIIRRLKSKINALLDIEKLESGSIELDFSKKSIELIIQHAIDSVQSLAEMKKIAIRVRTLGDTELSCDQERITDVIINFLHNAIKFSPKESEIEVEVKDLGNKLEVNVKDCGKGVKEEEREAIFERFRQSTTDSSEMQAQGSGLGLAIAKAVIVAHGGRIGVKSNEPVGSVFWFRISKSPALLASKDLSKDGSLTTL